MLPRYVLDPYPDLNNSACGQDAKRNGLKTCKGTTNHSLQKLGNIFISQFEAVVFFFLTIKALRLTGLIRDTFFFPFYLFSFSLLFVLLYVLSFQAKHNNNKRHTTRTTGNILQGTQQRYFLY